MNTPSAELMDPGTPAPPDDMPPADETAGDESIADDAPPDDDTPTAGDVMTQDRPTGGLVPLYTLLPDGATLPAAKPVIDTRLINELNLRASELLGLPLETTDECRYVDDRLAIVRKLKESVETQLDEPIKDAFSWHRQLTGLRATLTATAKSAIETVGGRLFARTRELQRQADDERRRLQEEANRQAREEAAREAAAAAASGDSHTAAVLREHAQTIQAPPVSVPRQEVLTSSATRTVWKGRLKGTDRSGEDHDESKLTLIRAIAQGVAPLAYVDLNWSAINKRASADKDTMDVPGLEAYEEGKLTARGGRR